MMPGEAPPNVLRMSYGFQVSRVYTTGLPAEMVNLRSMRDRPASPLIGPSVGRDEVGGTAASDVPIAVTI